MYRKILNFLKYHNLTPIIFTIVFVGFSLSMAASPQIRDAVYKKIEREVGIDNTLLLATNIDEFKFDPQILSIEEDEENYYVTYRFKTLGVVDNVWQETFKENLLKFPKVVLGQRDLADYVTEEIGEVILHEYNLLKDSQKIAKSQGPQQRAKVIEYSGLIGKVLNLEPKVILEKPKVEIAQIETLPKESALPEKTESTSSPQVNIDLLYQMIEEIIAEKMAKSTQTSPESSTSTPSCCSTSTPEILPTQTPTSTPEILPTQTPTSTPEISPTQTPTSTPEIPPTQTPTCTPNWQCTDWQPSTEEICNGEQFEQTRTCTDLNNCGTDEGKPIETQQATGTKDCSNSTSTPSASQ
ncbi:hypothetical protein H5T58_00270 [Candidatus Parcubacteria bacterium]|nr:hypothetical protein [Candidatus Parcubacteria bacterium]